MGIGSQQDVQNYLRSAAYNLLNTEEGFLVADKGGVGGDRDTLLVWLPSQIYPGRTFSQFEPSFVEKIEKDIEGYPGARYIILVESLEGISRTFTEITSAQGVKIRVPVQFFDTPFRVEEAPDAASAIKPLRDTSLIRTRVPQPYQQGGPDDSLHGPDLLTYIRAEIENASTPCVRFVVGGAGAGKSVLFETLFAIMYRDFIDKKNRRLPSKRPIPLIPDYLRSTYTIRTFALIESFLRTDVAVPVIPDTLEWMLTSSCCFWMFDGLDELYSGDPDFFEYILDLLTRPGSKAQIIVCARDSLLSSSDGFMQFLRSFSSDSESSVKVYRLKDWDLPAKRLFTWGKLMGRRPRQDEPDARPVTDFLNTINQTPVAQSLSGLPYYCSLLLDRFQENLPIQVRSEFQLLDQVVSAIQEREIKKGVILLDAFEDSGLDELLETIAADFCVSNYAGTSTDDIRVYSEMVLRPSLSSDEREKLITSIIQFPLFISGARSGVVSFKHELLAEFLFGKHILRTIEVDPTRAIAKLAHRPLMRDTLSFRLVIDRIMGRDHLRAKLLEQIYRASPADRLFRPLLQVWISSANGRIRMPEANFLEGRDLSEIIFRNVDMTENSLRHSVLRDTSFENCVLENAKFEGAFLVGTRFDRQTETSLRGAKFGNIEHFEYIWAGNRLIEDRTAMKEWVLEYTGIVGTQYDPCPTCLQVRGIYGKFVHTDGMGRRYDLQLRALSKGRIYTNAASPSDCIHASINCGFLTGPDFRGRVRRATGDQYNEMVAFMKDWRVSTRLKEMLDKLCPIKNCLHVPT